ncbi:hypothetical protein D3C79_777010 [compost metagenome]
MMVGCGARCLAGCTDHRFIYSSHRGCYGQVITVVGRPGIAGAHRDDRGGFRDRRPADGGLAGADRGAGVFSGAQRGDQDPVQCPAEDAARGDAGS